MPQKPPPPDYQWVRLGAQGAVIARAIFEQSGRKRQIFVAGHLHSFEMIQFLNNSSPAQMVSGGGATERDDIIDPAYFDKRIKRLNTDRANSEFLHKFTFAIVEPHGEGWQVTVIDEDGTTEARKFVVKKQYTFGIVISAAGRLHQSSRR